MGLVEDETDEADAFIQHQTDAEIICSLCIGTATQSHFYVMISF